MNNEVILTDEIQTALVGEVLLFGLLGKALYEEPKREWLEMLVSENVFSEPPFGAEQPEVMRGLEILLRWTETHTGGISDTSFSELKLDYTRLFIGLDKMPTAPWESVYFNRERLVFQEQTIQVRGWYAQFGLQVEKLNKEPDDHIGLEILFLSHLASLALQAIEKDDKNALKELFKAQSDFLSEHLLRWGPGWCKLVIEHAHTDFYRGLGYLTHGSLLALAALLNVELPKEATL